MITKEEFLKAVETINAYTEQVKKETITYDVDLQETIIENLDFSVRTKNTLKGHFGLNPFEHKVKDLSKISRNKLCKLRGVGSKTISEIIFFCDKANIKLLP